MDVRQRLTERDRVALMRGVKKPARGGLCCRDGLTDYRFIFFHQRISLASGLTERRCVGGPSGFRVRMCGCQLRQLPDHIERVQHQLHNVNLLATHPDDGRNDLLLCGRNAAADSRKRLHVSGGKIPFECGVDEIKVAGRVMGIYSEIS